VWTEGSLPCKSISENYKNTYVEEEEVKIMTLKAQWLCKNTGFKRVSNFTIMYLVDLESGHNTIHFMLKRF
jgi:hypothetical protein